MIRLFPKIDEGDLIVRLFHKAVANQWSSDSLDWDAPMGLTPRQAVALTNIITPVYLGEQSAMNGAARVLPELIRAGETAAQLYLSTFLLDEARHFEALTRLYRHVGQNPVPLRKMPEMFRYHHRLSQGDRIDWLWGILISDLFAREFYLTFAKVQPNALFGRMSTRILQDESRHQAFAHTYLKAAIATLGEQRRIAMIDMKDELLEIMESMNNRLREDTDALDFDGEAFFKDLIHNIEAHAAAVGLGGSGSRPGDGPKDRYQDADSWFRILTSKREQSLRQSGGVQWPGPAPETELHSQTRRAAVAVAPVPAVPALTEGDLRLLIGPLPRRPLEGARRRVFPATHPLALLASCGGCAVAILCRTRFVRSAAGAHA